jgi:hypothetical protein
MVVGCSVDLKLRFYIIRLGEEVNGERRVAERRELEMPIRMS